MRRCERDNGVAVRVDPPESMLSSRRSLGDCGDLHYQSSARIGRPTVFRIFYLLAVLLILFPAPASAQEVRGKVSDAFTEQPIAFA